ncbi:MAG: hypothetical protein AB7P03_08920 [Kofleriaceae bacterium]
MPVLKLMKRFALAVGIVSGLATSASAQQPPVADIVEGGGLKISEGTVLHPVLGIETGIVHNVFYEDSSPILSGMMRVIGEIAVGSLPPERLQAPTEQDSSTRHYGSLAFRLDVHAQYEEYLSSNDDVQAQRNFAYAALAQGLVYPRQTWQFAFSDELRRETRPVNFESPQDVDRDINRLALQLRYRPVGRRISGSLGYQNVIDYFEDETQQFANRMQHTVALNFGWQWFPLTRIFADASLGFFRPLGDDSTRIPSMPLRVVAGIASALTVKTQVLGTIGFGKGFYETGPDFTNVVGGLQFGYRYSPQARLAAAYEYDFHDSINANFYRDHALKLRMEQQIDRFAFTAAAELRFRLYRGVIPEVMGMGMATDRTDLIFSVPLGATYNFRNWIAATLDYRLTIDETDFRYSVGGSVFDDPSYTRQSLMAGVRAAY